MPFRTPIDVAGFARDWAHTARAPNLPLNGCVRERRARGSAFSRQKASTSIDPSRFGWQYRDRLGGGKVLMLLRTDSQGLERKDRVDHFLCGNEGTGVVREIDVESGVHLLIRVIRRRVFYHRDLVTELGGKANGRFDAGMRYESDDDELMDAVLLELQIQIRVGEATGTPMLCGDDLARLRLELGTDLATPRAVFEALVLPRCLLNGRNVLPGFVVARTVSMMQGIKDPKLRLPRDI